MGELQTPEILPGAIFADDLMPTNVPIHHRQQKRQDWFQTARQKVHAADLVFIDPDNGLEPDGFRHGSVKAGKSVTLTELRERAKPGRSQIVYHHHTRRAGGHHAEIDYWADRLRKNGFNSVDALRAKPYSPRVFFLLNPSDDLRRKVEQMAQNWHGLISWHSNVGSKLTTSCIY